MSEYASTESILAEYSGQTAEPGADSASPGQEQQSPTAPAAQAQPAAKEWEVPWNGQRIKANEDQMVKWASQGYDYSQKMNEFSRSREEAAQAEQARAAEYEEKYGRYRQIDDYVKTNPGWWEHVEQGWNQRQTYALPPEVKQAIEPLVSELREVKQFHNQIQIERQEQAARADDKALGDEIGSLQSKYSVDFSARDQAGQTLEYRVLKHAQEIGAKTFRAAFLDYHQDDLAKMYEQRGREAVQKDLQSRRQSGLLGTSQAPTLGRDDTPMRARTYDDAHKAALREYGIG